MTGNYKMIKFACYSAYFTMSTVFCLPALLFVTFNETYGISWTLLGTLVLINFCTQMTVDLIFTVFSKHFNLKKIIKIMPLITSLGLFVYALVPTFFPEYAFLGLAAGTVIFSVAAGLSEVFLSPTIASIPSDNPQREMSLLHSLYAFGVLTIIVVSTLAIRIFGSHNWMYITMVLALLPIITSCLFMCSTFPEMKGEENEKKDVTVSRKRSVGLFLCVLCIFFGSCAENAMTNWISSYVESALNIDKTMGDILGMAMFAVLLGLARILYAKYGKNIIKTLILGMGAAAICYITAGLSSNVAVAFCACIATGFATSMLWPGALIMMEENVPGVGVAAYALMAAGGDMGASIAPQLLGAVVDNVAASSYGKALALSMNITPEQIGMKAGMLVTSVFPIIGLIVLFVIRKHFRKIKNQ